MSSDSEETKKVSTEGLPPECQPLDKLERKVRRAVLKRLPDDLKELAHEDIVICFVRGYRHPHEAEKGTDGWIDKASEELTKCLTWRKDKEVDTVLQKKLKNNRQFDKIWKSGVYGRDKDGRIIIADQTGAIDPSALFETFSEEEVQMLHVQVMEALRGLKEEWHAEHGYRLYKHHVIMDLNGFNSGHMGAKFRGPLRAMMDIDQYYYPEILHRMYIINTPFLFKMLWKIASLWLDPVTKEKIRILGGEKEYMQVFKENGIEQDQLPEWLGGGIKKNALRHILAPTRDEKKKKSAK